MRSPISLKGSSLQRTPRKGRTRFPPRKRRNTARKPLGSGAVAWSDSPRPSIGCGSRLVYAGTVPAWNIGQWARAIMATRTCAALRAPVARLCCLATAARLRVCLAYCIRARTDLMRSRDAGSSRLALRCHRHASFSLVQGLKDSSQNLCA